MNRRLNRQMDILLAKENAGTAGSRIKSRALRKMMANKLATVGYILFFTIVILCVFAPLFTPYEATKMDLLNKLSPPSPEHWLGTDQIGRDIWSRILYGGRISMFVGLGGALGAAVIGVVFGVIGGYKGGILDGAIMKLSEILISFPQIILVLMLVTITGQSMWNLIFIFVATGWPAMYRLARAQMLSIREEEYVQALRAFGINDMKVAFKHMLPNAIGPLFVNVTLTTAMNILQEASLSFLGLGVPLEVSTWGNILNAAQKLDILRENWWVWLPVGIVVTLFVLSINFIGDGLRDAADPTQIG